MNLYFLRHAVAVDRASPDYVEDSQRPLTPDGRQKMERVARGMKALGLSFDWILSSPSLRAVATAEIVAKALELGRKMKFSEYLAPEGDPERLVEQIGRMDGSRKRLLVVGHEPYLSGLAGTLIGGHGGVGLQLKKGGLCKLAIAKLKFGRCAELKWLLTPRQLSLLADRPRRPPGKQRMTGARMTRGANDGAMGSSQSF